MVRFLSDEWVHALDGAVRSDRALADAMAGATFTMEQQVSEDEPGASSEVRYHVSFENGAVSVQPGPAPEPTVRFTLDRATAEAINRGTGSAQRAFMSGRLRVGGDLSVLLAHAEGLARLDDVFASVRARTTYGS